MILIFFWPKLILWFSESILSEILDINPEKKKKIRSEFLFQCFCYFWPKSNHLQHWCNLELDPVKKFTLHIIKSPSAIRYHSLILLLPLALESYNLSNKYKTQMNHTGRLGWTALVLVTKAWKTRWIMCIPVVGRRFIRLLGLELG